MQVPLKGKRPPKRIVGNKNINVYEQPFYNIRERRLHKTRRCVCYETLPQIWVAGCVVPHCV